MPDTILVTGAGSGMGLGSALHLASRGFRVFGTVLSEREATALGEAADAKGVTIGIVPMDVTKSDQIKAGVAQVVSEVGRIDGVVHFAGLGLRGFFEDLGMDEIRKVYDVNVFGIMELTQAVLPYMRAQKYGRIIITSSAAGRMGAMSISGYCSSKFALSGLGECLCQEVRPFGIFQVNRNRARRAVDPNSPYYPWFCQHEAMVDKILADAQFGMDDVALLVERILTSPDPKLHYMIGRKAKILTALRRYTPFDLFDRIYWPIVRKMVTSPKKQATGLS
jgi:NAD(P)-dependent dehydrogenase (short-subunit alcohol dehydrogenase family)